MITQVKLKLLKNVFYSIIAISLISCNSLSNNEKRLNQVFIELNQKLNDNLEAENFVEIIRIIKNQEDVHFTDSQINVLNSFTSKFIIKYKDLYVKNSQKLKDTIFNGFILNGTKSQFQSRLKKLQNQGSYKSGRLSTMIGIVEGFAGQFSNEKGSTKLLIKPFFDNSRLTSLEMHSFEQVGANPLNKEFVKNYGTPISGTDIIISFSELRKSNTEWKGVLKSIKENTFNPVKSFILMGGQLTKKEFGNYDHFWFTENFVISEISILHVYQTHKEFLSEYQKKFDDINKNKKVSESVKF